MTAFFVTDLKVAASLPPLDAMRQNPAPAGPRLREKMRQLVPEGAIDFGGMIDKLRIERDQFLPIVRASGASF